MKKLCVVGAGVIGLPTAVNLVTSAPPGERWEITLIAEQYSPNTTGDGAAGLWKPHSISGDQFVDIMRWGKVTKDYLYGLLNSSDARDAGVFMYSGYQMYKTQQPNREYAVLYQRYNDMNKDEVMSFGDQFLSGVFYTTLGCECSKYLPWLLDRFQKSGGKVIQKKIKKFAELYDDYDVIVNCTGVESYHLVPDKTLRPIRGQTIKVVAPWIKHFYMSGTGDYYVIPGLTTVTLGGTYYYDDWSEKPTKADREDIWRGCCQLVPSLKKADVIGEWSGFRPWRPKVRLDTERVTGAGRTRAIVHNYGHGGSGITLHWGCALEACELVKKELTGGQIVSKL